MELLVVITIIGVLIALLLPAIQAARESARRLQCTNHLKQISLACLAHESANKFLPTGGWGYSWAGQPHRGFDKRQPGGWLYNILPYMDLQPLHDLGGELNRNDPPAYSDAEKTIVMQVVQRISTPVSTYYCPSRRNPVAVPCKLTTIDTQGIWKIYGYNTGSLGSFSDSYPTVGALTDYAASGGDAGATCSCDGRAASNVPLRLSDGDGWPEHRPVTSATTGGWDAVDGYYSTGVNHVRSMVKMADIANGASNTYLAGEKWAAPEHYTDGMLYGDARPWDSGWFRDTVRWTGWVGDKKDPYNVPNLKPTQDCHDAAKMVDYVAMTHLYAFGSGHAAGFNMAFCDGSVHAMSYSIDLETHRRLGNIADGQPVDPKKAF